MTAFAFALAALMAVVVGLLLVPLLRAPRRSVPRSAYDVAIYRDQLKEIERDLERGVIEPSAAEAARVEIQRRLLAAGAGADLPSPKRSSGFAQAGTARVADGEGASRPHRWPNRWMAAAIAILIPAGGLLVYLALGSPATPGHPYAERMKGRASATAGGSESIDSLAARLAERLRNRPDDLEGWRLLARTYMSMERYGDAAKAYRQAMAATNNRPDVAVDYAEALIAGGTLVTVEARAILEAALDADPLNPKARYYLGVGMAERGDVEGALQAWVDLVFLSPADAAWLPAVREQIARAARELGLDPRALTPSAAAIPLAPARGRPALSGPGAEDVAAAANMSEAERAAMIRGMVERLAERLQRDPGDREGWLRLARAYEVLGEAEKAKEARARAERLQ